MKEFYNRYYELKNKSLMIKAKLDVLTQKQIELNQRHKDMKEDLETQIKSNSIQSLSIDTFKEMLDSMSQEHINRIQDLITNALQTIFYDCNYKVEILMGDKRNAKTAEFYLISEVNGDIIKSSFNDSIGGGIMAVVGFVLQVYYLGYLNRAPILFCDESFSQVSERYIDTLVDFIDELARQKDFIIVLITHDVRLMGKSKTMYKVNQGKITREVLIND